MVKAAISRLVTGTLTSPMLRDARRTWYTLRRRMKGAHAILHYFHDPADPYSHLTAQMLRPLLDRYSVELRPYIVPPPDEAAAPDVDRLQSWSRRDAALLADTYDLSFPDAGGPPVALAPQLASVLAAAIESGDFAAIAPLAGDAFWRGDAGCLREMPALDSEATDAARREGAATREKLGHYLGATFRFEGEWYWGIDRLHHLESRFAALGLDRTPAAPALAPVRDVTLAGPAGTAQGRVLYAFISFRSPYSYIALARAGALARHYGATLRLRFVLPMVMRGLPVPRAKRIYITLDTKREATRLGLNFGRMVDPVGQGVERGLAVLHHAILAGHGEAFAQSFLQGAFADGIDATTDSGLQSIAGRAGIDAAAVAAALADESWRDVAEANRAEMLQAGLWGVPSFRVDDGTAVWGQDRLWVIEQELQESK